jgi:hypothetical protein
MLGWIRNARIDMRTGIVVIVLALLVWGVMVYVNVRDFVPEELTQPRESTR